VDYDPKDFHLSFMFRFEDDDRPRPIDRLVSIGVSLVDFVDRLTADRMGDGFLPDDTEPEGRPFRNRYDEAVQKERSDAIAEEFPWLDVDGFQEPGTIWVISFVIRSEVGVLDIALFDDRP
jgi:hypothetical protein